MDTAAVAKAAGAARDTAAVAKAAHGDRLEQRARQWAIGNGTYTLIHRMGTLLGGGGEETSTREGDG